MQDLQKDWIRWTKIERAAAIVIVMALGFGIPTALVGSIHSTALAHNASHTGRAS